MKRIATVGYEKTSIDQFLRTLNSAGVEHLIDIRELPLSRKKGFSKRALSDVLDHAGIGYTHIRDLGDPKLGRDAAKSGQVEKFRKIFAQHMATDAAIAALNEAANIASDYKSALLCFEKDYRCCHRAIVAEHLRLDYGFEIDHLTIEPAPTNNAKSRRRSSDSCKGNPQSELSVF